MICRARPVLVLALTAALVTAAGQGRAACAPGEVEFAAPGGAARFHVEVAANAAQRAYGLMNRASLAADAGMIFIFPQPVEARFWMKDTLIPLDMIFADPAGRITRIAENAQPMDESVIDGGPGVAYVIEVNAGQAQRLGLRPGMALRGAMLDQDRAAWSCSAP